VTFVDENDYSQLKINNGVLEFGSIEYYESFLELSENPKPDFLVKHITKLDFQSYSNTQQDRSEDVFEDDFMTSILDKNQIVKIGKWFIRINPETENVYASCGENAYELVLREDRTNEKVYTFATSEEVLVYLNDEDLLNERGLFCGEDGVASQAQGTGEHYISNTGHKMGGSVHYVKYGIYFTLKAYAYYLAYDGTYRCYIQLENIWYHVKCGTTVGPYSNPWYHNNPALQNDQKYSSYQGSKALNGFHFKARVRIEIPNMPNGNNPYTVVYTPWARIQANNPYYP